MGLPVYIGWNDWKTLHGLRATQRHKEIRGIFNGGAPPLWLTAWRHQAITWTNAAFIFNVFCGIQVRKIPMNSIGNMRFEIIHY